MVEEGFFGRGLRTMSSSSSLSQSMSPLAKLVSGDPSVLKSLINMVRWPRSVSDQSSLVITNDHQMINIESS
ncbi:hypothetical protein Q3G72_000884 [Acer saccharum]|nr:hypothetical protein Q3G72_000884 [Acer saccharum]